MLHLNLLDTQISRPVSSHQRVYLLCNTLYNRMALWEARTIHPLFLRTNKTGDIHPRKSWITGLSQKSQNSLFDLQKGKVLAGPSECFSGVFVLRTEVSPALSGVSGFASHSLLGIPAWAAVSSSRLSTSPPAPSPPALLSTQIPCDTPTRNWSMGSSWFPLKSHTKIKCVSVLGSKLIF